MSELARAPAADREAAPSKKSPPAKNSSRLMLQRKCACGAGAGAGGECDACAAATPFLQRHNASSSAAQHDAWPSSVNDAISRAGQPLDADTRHFMEDRFGTGFGSVRVHDDTAAAASAREVDAQAYTVGQHIVFGDGHYQPHSESGRHLLAHELAHTVQQQGLQRSGVSNLADHGPDYRQLEVEADHAADRVMRGAPLTAAGLSRSGPRLSRKPDKAPADAGAAKKDEDKKPAFVADYDTETLNRHLTLTGSDMPVQIDGKANKTQADYTVSKFVLPAQKGPKALAHYQKPYRPLQATFEWSSARPTLYNKVASDGTSALRDTWLQSGGYATGKPGEAAANKRWVDLGGGAAFPSPPSGPTCQVDHIQELQVGGDNKGDNLQLLDKIDNGASGGLIQQQLETLAKAAFADAQEALGNKRPKRVSLSFSDVAMQGAPVCGVCYQLGERFRDAAVTAATEKPSVDVEVVVPGNKSFTLKLPADKSTSIPLIGTNAGIAKSIKGLTLTSYERDPKGKGHDSIRATLDDAAIGAKPGSKSTVLTLKIGPNRKLLPPTGKLPAPIKAEFAKLSPITFTTLSVDDAGASATGTIKPSLPLLPVLDVALDPQGFRVGKALDPAKIKPPFPGVKVTEASIMMELAPAFKPVGTLSFEFGGAKKVADLKLTASADDAGLVLKGDLFIYIPGVDQAKGDVTYQAGQWSGGAHIEATRLKMPFVKGGAIDVSLKGGKLDAGGKVNLELPGKNDATLEVFYTQSRWIFKGRGRIATKSKYLKPIEATILVQDDLFRATGSTGIAFSGLDGTVVATYENRAGKERVYGKGNIKIAKGRANGSIDVELHANETLTGKGKLSYEIKKDMVATAGITIDDKQKITFDGELTFPDIKLFPRFPAKEEPHTIFSASGTIPIPGASIGPIGLKVKLFGSLGYYYYVGPGVLTGTRATVKFSPFEPDPDFAFSLKAKASIPAAGGITGTVGATLSLDALIAEVGGTISIVAKAGLEGKAELDGEIAYSKDRFSIDASAYVGGGVVLSAALNATLFAEAGVWKFKVRTEKTWTLAEGKFDTDLKLGVRMPLHYDSVDGFRMPKLSDVKPEPAELNLDAKKMLGKLFGDTTPKEREV